MSYQSDNIFLGSVKSFGLFIFQSSTSVQPKTMNYLLPFFSANGAEIQEALLAKTGQKTVPNVFVANKHLGGASDTEAAFKDGRLMQLLSGDETQYDYDLFVVGGGSGGLACSKVCLSFYHWQFRRASLN